MIVKIDTLIIGAGFAGASTAYHLSAASDRSILMLERESEPGLHASGRNAALLLQPVSVPLVRRLNRDSRLAYEKRAAQTGYGASGSVLVGRLSTLQEVYAPREVESHWIAPEGLPSEIPLLEGYAFEAALQTPTDGVMDIERLLRFYLQGARSRGVQLRLDSPVRSIEGEGPFLVRAGEETFEAKTLVNAAGAWAGQVAQLAGASDIPLTPMKRHLFWLSGIPLSPDWPFVWDLERDFYFRPDKGRLLFSLCDESTDATLDTSPAPGISERLVGLIEQHLPALRGFSLDEVRACFRTHSPDGAPLIGPDPTLPSFFWVAALGGYGMGASWELGRMAAAGLMGRDGPEFH